MAKTTERSEQIKAGLEGGGLKIVAIRSNVEDGLREAEDFQIILLSISQMKTSDEHFRALQVMCDVIRELYLSLLELVAKKRPIAAQALVRTLFETVVNGSILIRKPEKLDTFKRHGKYTHLRTLHFSEISFDENVKARRIAMQKKYKLEIQALFAEFGDRNWHGLDTKEAFVAAGFSPDVYDKYYRPASAIAHGQPHALVTMVESEWTFGRSPSKDAHLTIGAYVTSGIVVLHFLDALDHRFKLGIGQSLIDCDKKLKVHIQSHYDLA